MEIVINKYKIVHTGPKTQSGGLKKGLFNKETLEEIVNYYQLKSLLSKKLNRVV